MPKTKISEYSTTNSNNTDIESINIDEGCAPSGINNAIRELMVHLKEFQTGSSGDPLTVAGGFVASGGFTSNTMTVTGILTASGGTIMSSTNTLSGSNIISGNINSSGSANTFSGGVVHSGTNTFSSSLIISGNINSSGTTNTFSGGNILSGTNTFSGTNIFSSDVTLNAQSDLRFADSDSSNWVAFQAPATVASNVTWTLPATDGTSNQVLATNGSGTLSWATAGGGGKVLQVIKSHITGKASTTSASLAKLATSASITPSATSSKILVIISSGYGNADTGNADFSIVRTIGGSDTTIFADFANKQGATAAYQYDAFAWSDLDSPSTTSAITYSVSAKRTDGNATPFVGGRATDSSYGYGVMFILMEIGV